MTIALYLLRVKQIGLSLSELDELEEGDVFDMFTESSNDSYDGYKQLATQEDFNSF